MSSISAIVAGIAFVALAAVNVMVMLEASQPWCNGTTRTRLIAVHRAGDYLFVITPMISMLCYIDDLNLATHVTLLYCVRTRADIIFRNELRRLRKSLTNFNCEVCLSRPDPTWNGHSGHLTEEFVSQQVTDLDPPTFFVCGPKGFMDNASQVLLTLDVNQDRILQESFGENKRSTESHPLKARPVENVVFIQSKKVYHVSAGTTLLDVAENNGVQIPYGCRQGLYAVRAPRGS
jgi:ferredoxin-NADP reductase